MYRNKKVKRTYNLPQCPYCFQEFYTDAIKQEHMSTCKLRPQYTIREWLTPYFERVRRRKPAPAASEDG